MLKEHEKSHEQNKLVLHESMKMMQVKSNVARMAHVALNLLILGVGYYLNVQDMAHYTRNNTS